MYLLQHLPAWRQPSPHYRTSKGPVITDGFHGCWLWSAGENWKHCVTSYCCTRQTVRLLVLKDVLLESCLNVWDTKSLCWETTTGMNPPRQHIFHHIWFCNSAAANHSGLYAESRFTPRKRCLFIAGHDRERWSRQCRASRSSDWLSLSTQSHSMPCKTHQGWVQWQINI